MNTCLTAQSEKEDRGLNQVFLRGSEKNQGFLEAFKHVFFPDIQLTEAWSQ